jgi:hypothetical protein
MSGLLLLAGLGDAEVVAAHEFDVLRVVLDSILECIWDFFGVDGEDGHSIVE